MTSPSFTDLATSSVEHSGISESKDCSYSLLGHHICGALEDCKIESGNFINDPENLDEGKGTVSPNGMRTDLETSKPLPSDPKNSFIVTRQRRRALTIQPASYVPSLSLSEGARPNRHLDWLSCQLFSPLLDPITTRHFKVGQEDVDNIKPASMPLGEDDSMTLKDDNYLVLSYERERDHMLAENKDLLQKIQECRTEQLQEKSLQGIRVRELESELSTKDTERADLLEEMQELKRSLITEKSKRTDLVRGLEQLNRVLLTEKKDKADLLRGHHQAILKRDRDLATNSDIIIRLQEDAKEQMHEKNLLKACVKKLEKDVLAVQKEKGDSLLKIKQDQLTRDQDRLKYSWGRCEHAKAHLGFEQYRQICDQHRYDWHQAHLKEGTLHCDCNESIWEYIRSQLECSRHRLEAKQAFINLDQSQLERDEARLPRDRAQLSV